MTTNRNCIVRLSKYKNALYRLKGLGFVRVFSDNLADAVGVTSSQVRKDFSLFGLLGNKRGGYVIDELIARLNTLLGKNQVHKVVVVGVGNIGRALINYGGFQREGIQIVAGFDIDPTKAIAQLQVHFPIYPLAQLKDFVQKENSTIGVVAVPDVAAQMVVDTMVEAGIKGILNFAPIRLKVPDGCTINNVNLGLELETVIYFVSAMENEVRQNG